MMQFSHTILTFPSIQDSYSLINDFHCYNEYFHLDWEGNFPNRFHFCKDNTKSSNFIQRSNIYSVYSQVMVILRNKIVNVQPISNVTLFLGIITSILDH